MHRGFDVWDFLRGQTTDRYRPIWTCPPESLERAFVANAASATGGEQYFAQYFANVADRKSEEDWFAPRVFNRASEFLESAKGVGPFFLTVDVYDPHAPWDPPEKYTNMYSDGADGPEPYAPVYGNSDYLTERQLDRMNALYAGELTMMDRWLGRFMDKMEELSLFEDTLVLLLSDHGMILGEHGLVGKPHYALYPETVDVPFMIRHPGGKLSGDAHDYFASTHDVAPTILGHLGIDPPEQMTGQNLMALFEGGEPAARPHFTLGYHDHVWARDDRYAMFSAADGSGAKLFDVQQDPAMNDDIAAGDPDVVKRMYDGYVLRDAGGPLPDYG
jgi:arylsulfatase A-like enzyme